MKGRLVALSSAAVFAVYAAGYMKTRAAADRWMQELPPRVAPAPASADTRVASTLPEPAAPSSPAPPAARLEAPARAPRHQVIAPEQTAVSPDAVATEPSAIPTDALPPVSSAPIAVGAPIGVAPAPSLALVPAPASPADAVPTPSADAVLAPKAPKIKDGTYLGWGTSRHGDIQAAVTIEGGKITGARIAQCLTRYSCSWIAHLPAQVISRQSADVDYVSGATQSSDAFATAIADALAKAK